MAAALTSPLVPQQTSNPPTQGTAGVGTGGVAAQKVEGSKARGVPDQGAAGAGAVGTPDWGATRAGAMGDPEGARAICIWPSRPRPTAMTW